MTQEILNCLQGKAETSEALEGESYENPRTGEEKLTSRTSLHPEGEVTEEAVPEERIATPVTRSLVRNDREGKTGARDSRMLQGHLAALYEQAAELPGFDLEQALHDPAFVRLTAPGVGVSVRDAWYALHREETERRRAEENRAMLARAAASSARRPREGGGSGGTALIAADYRSLSRAEQLRVKQRIFEAGARGEKVYP